MKTEKHLRNVRIGITLGCPAGVGGEVTLKALPHIESGISAVLIGRKSILDSHYPSFMSELSIPFFNADNPTDAPVSFYNIESGFPIPELGKGNLDTASESISYIDASIELWKRGLIDAVVTAPVHKGLIEKSGLKFMGHTEYFAEKINEPDPVMMMYSEKLAVVLVTTHYKIADIPKLVTADKIESTIRTADSALRKIRGRKPKIALAGLDPHCGDNGAIGTFDTEVSARVVEKLKNEIDVSGPYSADTLFMKSKWEQYDVAIAHYHDQGLIPFKILAFDKGVNVTLGLSLVRTSVDHGTAYDIAGKNTAGCQSMVEAVDLAALLVRGR
ncbi:MAG: 4-hydroxythreonine-4-phosphate dehydrogenase PdxA [Spirochaetes bacterium]|nr:4-hydroxythreonine-4-phosphate dehydrogenase PdxA [Spirochaetota bacterium]